MKRIFFDIALFASIFIFPWWVGSLLVIAGIFIFKDFYEYIVACVVIYALYSIPSERMISSSLFFALFTIISYLVLHTIRENIIFYKK